MALALVLLIGAGLCLQGLRQARRTELGLDPDHVLTASLQIGMNGYTPQTGLGFYRELRQRLARASRRRGGRARELVPARPLRVQGDRRLRRGLPLRRSARTRPTSSPSSRRATSPPCGSRSWPAATSPTPTTWARSGSRSSTRPSPAASGPAGPARTPLPRARRVADDRRRDAAPAKYNRLDEAAWPFFYLPDQQGVSDLDLSLAVRTAGDPSALVGAVRGAVRGLDPRVEPLRTQPLRELRRVGVLPPAHGVGPAAAAGGGLARSRGARRVRGRWRTRSPSAPRSSACAWRSARRGATSSGWCCDRAWS